MESGVGVGTLRAAVVAVSLSFGCGGTTAVNAEVTTDVACTADGPVTTSITAGRPEEVDTRAPAAVTTRCDPSTGRVGSIVFVPSGADDEPITIKVVTAIHGKSPAACGADGTGCIVVKRDLRYHAGEIEYVAIAMPAAALASAPPAAAPTSSSTPPPPPPPPPSSPDDGAGPPHGKKPKG